MMVNIDKRLEYLADEYNVFMGEEFSDIITNLENEGYEVTKIQSEHFNPITHEKEEVTIAVRYSKLIKTVVNTQTNQEEKRMKVWVKVHEDVFASMIAADPTSNKVYLQWMLTLLIRLIKDGRIEDATRFASEDLPQANQYLELFEANKRKKMFKELSLSNYALQGINDPTNINQYKSLSQLFDSVDPFIEREASDLERAMKQFVDAGHAEMPVRDRNFTLFIPLTRDANVLFDKFASWCTAKVDNGMFTSYTNYSTPLSDKSKIYIIINNKFFTGESNELYQLHFESKQLRDRTNGDNLNIYDTVISNSQALGNYFYEELTPLAKAHTGSLKDNSYVDYLIQFGFTDILFDMEDSDTPTLKFSDKAIPTLPNLSRFKNVRMIYFGNISLHVLTPTICALPKLSILSIPKNKLTSLPKEIGKCKGMLFCNLLGNKLKNIPDEIGELDKTRGGSLIRISVLKKDIGEDNYNKLKRLLPSVLLTEKA
jgi:hypothetical protein